ncbi:AAA domain-containing protein [Thermomonospora umbrina]|uniref:AAA domain-containing protein n=2 Tax=Thermomonospora umbrina TaxID=111806 RepID=A0A3D9T447_9ACTN|nr:AAA domain-containing protein [Thermomonospora umbrina]
MFSPQSVPKVDRRSRVGAVVPGEPLPWQDGHEFASLRLGKGMTWRHTVYGGVFSLERVREVLERAFGRAPEDLDGRPLGESALLALTVTAEGQPLLGSQELSGCAWAVGRTVTPGPADGAWLNGFDAATEECASELAALTDVQDEDDTPAEVLERGFRLGLQIGHAELVEFTESVAERFGVGSVLAPAGLRIASVPVPLRSRYDADGSGFLNSFFVADLGRVGRRVAEGDYGRALDTYLRGGEDPDPAARVDVRRAPDTVHERVAPGSVPAGRWPTDPRWALALSQQFAVSTAMAELMDGAGLLAVNGPPGTGKTTMLRDLLAAIVVERASRLAELPSPAAAFAGQAGWRTGNHWRSVRSWQPRLTGFEVVVASANNGAVENVSLELPQRDAVHMPADYFAAVADRVLRREGRPLQGWGTIAARLGNKKNRQEFVGSFWFSDRDSGEPGLMDILKEYRTGGGPLGWSEAVAAFRATRREVERLRGERDEAYGLPAELSRAERDHAEATRASSTARGRHAAIRRRVAAAEDGARSAERLLRRTQEERTAHAGTKPGLIDTVFTLGRVTRAWYRRDEQLADAVTQAQQRLDHAHQTLDAQGRAASSSDRNVAQLERRARELSDRVTTVRARLETARSRWGDAFLDGRHWADEESREKTAPWTDAEWNEARSRLFLDALRLHQAFLAAQADTMTKNLRAAMEILQGAAPSDAPVQAVRAAWQSLFFVVPLVSTTFASFDRVFSHLGREDLGWLFIDEAGQAAPQMAVGALWRARRAVIVGDPLQLEPVVTLPFTAQQALRRHFGVRPAWLPGRTSVQRLADQTNRYGTYLPEEDGQVWVGAPLRVHRRCDEPMFGISNRVAYDGLMVYGVTGRTGPFPDITPAPPSSPPASKWIDVVSTESRGHWIPAEGAELRRVLTGLRDACGIAPDQIFVISPFRDVAAQIERFRREPGFGGLRGGTIHTAQGKEADVVVFVLGGDPAKPGAKSWAAQKPNLVNVAASRARRRLYVIGNHREWSRQRHFDVLAAHLPRTDPIGPPSR